MGLLFGWLSNVWTGGSGIARLANGEFVPIVPGGKESELVIIYGCGYMAVFLVLALLHVHAWRRRHELELTPVELHITREII